MSVLFTSTSEAYKALLKAREQDGTDAKDDDRPSDELLATTYLTKHFGQFAEEKYFLGEVSATDLAIFLQRSDISVGESELLQILIKWLKHDWTNRKEVASDLLQHIRLGLIQPYEKMLTLLDDDIVALPGWEMNLKLLKFLYERQESGAVMSQKNPNVFAPRAMHTLAALGNNETFHISVQYWDPSHQCFEEIQRYYFPKFPIPMLKDFRMIHVDHYGENQIYFVGGQFGPHPSKVMFRYVEGAKKWTALKRMGVPRSKTALVHLDGFIYAIGGGNCFEEGRGDACSDVDSWEDVTDDDSDIADDDGEANSSNVQAMTSEAGNEANDNNSGAAEATSHEDESKHGSSAERYSISKQEWQHIAPLPLFGSLIVYRHMSAVTMGGKIILGTHDVQLIMNGGLIPQEKVEHNSILVYDPSTNEWKMLLKEYILPDLHKEQPYGIFLDGEGTCFRVYREQSGKVHVNEVEIHLEDKDNPTATIGKSHDQQKGIPDDTKSFIVCTVNNNIYLHRNGVSYKFISGVDSEAKLEEAKKALEFLEYMNDGNMDLFSGMEYVSCTFDLAKILKYGEDDVIDEADDPFDFDYGYERNSEDDDDDDDDFYGDSEDDGPDDQCLVM